MAPGVAADGMTRGSYSTRNFGFLLDILSNQKKCRLHAMAFQHFKHVKGIGIVGPVIVG